MVERRQEGWRTGWERGVAFFALLCSRCFLRVARTALLEEEEMMLAGVKGAWRALTQRAKNGGCQEAEGACYGRVVERGTWRAVNGFLIDMLEST